MDQLRAVEYFVCKKLYEILLKNKLLQVFLYKLRTSDILKAKENFVQEVYCPDLELDFATFKKAKL